MWSCCQCPDLVGQDRFDFVGRMRLEKRVVKDDLATGTEAREIRVGMAALPRGVHDQDLADFNSRLLHECLHHRLERLPFGFMQWLEVVEQRGDRNGHKERIERRERHAARGRPIATTTAATGE
jgi:hypothetical protein